MKFEALCQSGLGSSFMVQMNIQNILNEENVKEDITVEHSDVGVQRLIKQITSSWTQRLKPQLRGYQRIVSSF